MLDIAKIISITLLYSAPLMFTAMGGIMSENAGVVNVGLEGMMTIGALVGASVAYFTGNPWIAFLAAGLAGMLLALLHAIATVTFHADHVISGTAINFIGPGLSLFLCRLFFDGAAMTKTVAQGGTMPKVFAGVFPKNSFWDIVLSQHITIYMAFALIGIVWFMLYKTKLGLRIRAVGEHPKAADTLGINVNRIKYFSVLIAGMFAGFGGAAMSIAVVSHWRITLISGQGFIALAAVIFGKWKPQGALAACLLFGASQGLVVYFGGNPNVPLELLNMLPYVITLVVLILFVGESRGPAANGQPYIKD
ncbi:MAG: ABC transporter permease [Tissierellia bacterium]|nr:ABC transporter permease [Tissierellia bacterium]